MTRRCRRWRMSRERVLHHVNRMPEVADLLLTAKPEAAVAG